MLDFIKIEFGLLSAQKRKVRIYIFLQLSKGKKLSCPLPVFINPSFWQDKNQRVSPRYKKAEKINKKLKIFRFQIKKTEILVSTKFGLLFNGCGHFLLYPFHLSDTLCNFILPLNIIINKSMTEIIN